MIPIYTQNSKTLYNIIACGLLFSFALFTLSIPPVHAQVQNNQSIQDKIPRTFSFTKTLSKNMTDYPDIVYLKKVLNNDPRTALATDSCISPHTDGYFDQATKDAVIRFQELYRSEVLTPAGTRTATGIVGQYTRLKLNSLLRSNTYANIVASIDPNQAQNQALQQAVNQYLGQVNQTLLQTPSTSTTSTTTASNPISVTASSSANPIVNSYLAQVNQYLTTNATSTIEGAANQASATTTPSPQQGTGNQSLSPEANAAVNTYFQNLNNALNNPTIPSTTTPSINQTPNTNTSYTQNNPAVIAYLNSVNTLLGQTLLSIEPSTSTPSSTPAVQPAPTPVSTPSNTSSGLQPKILAVSPLSPVTCQQTITIIGQNFSPTQNMLIGTMGTFITTANTIATTSTSSIQAITFKLSDFTDYMFNQSVNAGYTREIRFTLLANGQTSNDLALISFTFPGEKRSSAAIAQTKISTVEKGIANINIYGGTTLQNPNMPQNLSLLKNMERIDIRVFSDTVQGQLIKTIGGDNAVQTFYKFTPNGTLNQNLQGNTATAGVMSFAGGSAGGVFGGSSAGGNGNGQTSNTNNNSDSSGSNGLLAGLAGVAVGAGVAAGVGAVLGGAAGSLVGAATTGFVGNFGGTLIVNLPCPCSANSLVTLQDVRGYPIQLIFQPGISQLYAYGVGLFRPGAYLLGDYVRVPMQCLMYTGVSCTPFGIPFGIIRQVGTSI